DHERIAVHPRNMSGQSYITVTEHMPLNHQQALESKGWSRDELIGKAKRVGPNTEQVAIRILGTSIYMEQNYKSCFGMIMLQKKYGTARLENACARALTGTRINYTMIKNILQSGLDKQLQIVMDQALPLHDNIRGATQYL
ncbi:IS21 family transposase, partial [Flavitalea antarctica]